jgi:hypothetical protein
LEVLNSLMPSGGFAVSATLPSLILEFACPCLLLKLEWKSAA